MPNRLSIHPKLVAVVDAILNFIMLWWLSGLTSGWILLIWVFFRLLIWLFFIRLMYYPAGASRLRHFISLLIFCAGALSLIIFSDWNFARLLLSVMFVAYPFFSFWLLPAADIGLPGFLKPYSRLSFMMCIIGLAGLFALVSAIASFQLLTTVSAWLWIFLLDAICTVVAAWWWREYGVAFDHKLISRALIWLAMFAQFIWALLLLPLGYLAGGFVFIWCWYILWLLIRFSMSSDGIKWKKQAIFLGINAALFASFLLFAVKWR